MVVTASIIDNALELIGSAMYCSDSGDSAILKVKPTQSIQWFKDGDLVNGATRTDYRVTQSGEYSALLFNSDGCSLTTEKQAITIDDPTQGITYPVQYAVVDLPFDLEARQFGDSVFWSPGTWLNTQASYTPIFDGLSEQLYTIEIRTKSGCVTIDTQMVKTVKGVEVYVPTAFTPNNDGLNDFLRPIVMGIKEIQRFAVFNRWGQLVFDTKTERPGWNGLLMGSPMPSQAVVWVFEGIGVDNKKYIRKGTSVLIR